MQIAGSFLSLYIASSAMSYTVRFPIRHNIPFKSIQTFGRNHINFAITAVNAVYVFRWNVHVCARQHILIGFFAVPINNRICYSTIGRMTLLLHVAKDSRTKEMAKYDEMVVFRLIYQKRLDVRITAPNKVVHSIFIHSIVFSFYSLFFVVVFVKS